MQLPVFAGNRLRGRGRRHNPALPRGHYIGILEWNGHARARGQDVVCNSLPRIESE